MFTLQGSIFNIHNFTSPGNYFYRVDQQPVKFIPCREATWLRELKPLVHDLGLISEFGICIQNSTILLSKNQTTQSHLDITLTDCTSAGCLAFMSNLTEKVFTLQSFAFSKTFNVKDYTKPIKFLSLNLDSTDLDLTNDFGYKTSATIQDVTLTTNDGWLLDHIHKLKILSIADKTKTTTHVVKGSTPVIPTGTYPVRDNLKYQLQVLPSNSRQDIERTYFNIWDAAGNMGGIIECMFWTVIILYTKYNSFYMVRN